MINMNYCGIVYDIKVGPNMVEIHNLENNRMSGFSSHTGLANAFIDQLRTIVKQYSNIKKAPKYLTFYESIDILASVFEEA